MRRRRLSWFVALVASVVGVVGAWPTFVDAHAAFVGAPSSVAAGSDVSLTMNVPHERDDTTYNVEVAIQLPSGWSGVACQGKPTWTCSVGAESGHDVVRFTKAADAAPAEDENFAMTLHAGGSAGTASFPTLQTYNTGETVAWIGAPGSAEPAPSLQVTGSAPATTAAPPPTTNAPATTSAPTTQPTAPASTAAPTTTAASATTAAPAATTTTRPTTTTAVTTTTVFTATSTSIAETTTSFVATTVDPAANDSDSGGSSGTAIAAVILGVLVAGGAAGFYLRRRAST